MAWPATSPSAIACCWRHATAGGIQAEIVGFRQGLAQAMPFGSLDGLGPGSVALFRAARTGSTAASHSALAAAGRWRWPTPGSAACSTRWAGRWTAWARCRPARPMPRVRGAAAGCDAAGAAWPAARPRRACAELLRDLPAGPAARPVLRLRRRQIHPARDARAAHRLRRRGARPGRRARAGGARIPRGRSGRGRAGPIRGGRRHLGLAAADAPARRPMPP